MAIVVAPRVFLPSFNGGTLSAAFATKDTQWWKLSVMFEWHETRCAFHRQEPCGLRVWYNAWKPLGTPIFTVGDVGTLAVTTKHETLATFSAWKGY